jgi:hypothetical protein
LKKQEDEIKNQIGNFGSPEKVKLQITEKPTQHKKRNSD